MGKLIEFQSTKEEFKRKFCWALGVWCEWFQSTKEEFKQALG